MIFGVTVVAEVCHRSFGRALALRNSAGDWVSIDPCPGARVILVPIAPIALGVVRSER